VALFLTTLQVILPSGLSTLNPDVLRKTYPSQTLTFILVHASIRACKHKQAYCRKVINFFQNLQYHNLNVISTYKQEMGPHAILYTSKLTTFLIHFDALTCTRTYTDKLSHLGCHALWFATLSSDVSEQPDATNFLVQNTESCELLYFKYR
jgi:hypothetical protein